MNNISAVCIPEHLTVNTKVCVRVTIKTVCIQTGEYLTFRSLVDICVTGWLSSIFHLRGICCGLFGGITNIVNRKYKKR